MSSLVTKSPPKSCDELLARCFALEGATFSQLAERATMLIPSNNAQRKGWLGQLVELLLGADAGSQAQPDFRALGIELKTLPIGPLGKPIESTFITTIPLLTIHQQTWSTSECYRKLQRVLWLPIEGDTAISYSQRRVGRAFLWSPNSEQEAILQADWTYLTSEIATGQLTTLDARVGEYLQIRPKAAHGKSLCYYFDAEGNKVQTLPRGFYLRSRFTELIYKQTLAS